MFTELSPDDLARVLPGSWSARATNFPEWLDTATHSHSITFTLTAQQPLTFFEVVSYEITGGEKRTIESIDRLRGAEFLRRSTKKSELASSRWAVSGVSDDDNVIVIRFAKTRAVPEGLSVLVRDDTVALTGVRALVAHNTEKFGLTVEDFAALAWFGGVRY